MRLLLLVLFAFAPFGLSVRAQTATPDCPHPVRIATWNIENFSVARAKDEAMLKALVDTWIALDADIVALQEIGAEQSMEILLAKVEEISGRQYDFVLAYWPGARQRVGFAWDRATIQPNGEPERIDSVRLRNLRPAFAQDFIAGGYDFTLVTLHLKASMDDPSRRIREAQAGLLVRWLAERPPDADPDVIVLGDFNDYADSQMLAALAQALYFTDDTLPPDAYTYIRDDFDSRIDHIAVTRGAGAEDEFCDVRIFDYAAIGLSEQDFQELASDHLPVLAEFHGE